MTKPKNIHKWIEDNQNTPDGAMVKANLESTIYPIQEMVDQHIKEPIVVVVYPKDHE